MEEERHLEKTGLVQRRGDSFDIGEYLPQNVPNVPQDDVFRIIQNPEQLQDLLNINEEQAANIRAVITGAGAGLAHKYLSKPFGDAVAGGLGGLIGGIIASKLLRKE